MKVNVMIKNISTSLLQQFVTVLCGFIIPKLIIETYGSDVNGLISSITQFLGYIVLFDSGFGPVVKSILYKPIVEKDKEEIECILKASQKFFRKIAKIFILYILILCLVYPVIVNKEFNSLYTISLILIVSISTFAEYFFGMTYKLYLQADQKTYITSYLQIASIILNSIFIIVLIKLGFNIHIVKLVSALIFVLRPILQSLYVKKKYNINLKNGKDDYKIKQKWDGLAQHIAAVIHSNTDITILTIFTNVKEVSVYSIYLLVISGVKKLLQSLNCGIDAFFGNIIAKKDNNDLNKKFSMYEFLYYTIIAIMFICTMVLIIPFIEIYTNGIEDANYIRPVFAILIVISEFVWAIRVPYSSIVLSAGYFKQTQKGAWLEAFLNIIISIILVFNYGIIGVAIGTIVAMSIRTIEFIYCSSKYILKRELIQSIKKIISIIVQTIILVPICFYLKRFFIINSYLTWGIYAMIIMIISSIVILISNIIIYNKDFNKIKEYLKMKRK